MSLTRLLDDLDVDFSLDARNGSYSTFVVRPTTTTEVSNLFKTLSPLVGRREVSIHLHGAPNSPSSDSVKTVQNVTVDLRFLRGISLNLDKTVVNVHVGETWSLVQEELDSHGLTLLGSSGPISFTGRGSARDSVEEFRVVLTSGAVLSVNPMEDTALWKALKANSDHGAVITSLKVRTCESATLHGGIAHYVPESFSLLADAAVRFAKSASADDTRVMFCAGHGYGYRLNTCSSFPTKSTENHDLPQPFLSLPGRVEDYKPSHTRPDTRICEDLADTQRAAVRSLNATFTARADLALIIDIHQEWFDLSKSLEDVDDHIFSIAFSPKAIVAQPNARGSKQTINTESEREVLFTAMLSSSWKSTTDDERVREGIDMLLAKSWAMSCERHLQCGSIFADYAHYSGSVLNEYGGKDTMFPS